MTPDKPTTVKLYGWLGSEFGKRFELYVGNVAEVMRLLQCNFPVFRQRIAEHQPGFHILIGTESLDPDLKTLHYPHGNQTIRIIPAIYGAKSGGLLQIVIGVVLVAASLSTGGAALAASGAFGAYAVGAAGAIGTALVLGGVSQLLFKPPKPQGPQDKEENKPSYLFNGAVNTVAQGNCVSVGYGQGIWGSSVISAGIKTEEFPA